MQVLKKNQKMMKDRQLARCEQRRVVSNRWTRQKPPSPSRMQTARETPGHAYAFPYNHGREVTYSFSIIHWHCGLDLPCGHGCHDSSKKDDIGPKTPPSGGKRESFIDDWKQSQSETALALTHKSYKHEKQDIPDPWYRCHLLWRALLLRPLLNACLLA